MKYDFTTILDRSGHDALAVDAPLNYFGDFGKIKRKDGFNVIPMWVADMNFAVSPSITDAIKDRLNYPTFGYFMASEEYYNAIINWQRSRNNVEALSKENIGYENGVLGGLISSLNALASYGDVVLLHSPTYIGFTMSIENAGYRIIHSPLRKDDKDIWRMDYEDMEKKIIDNNIKVAILCNPFNPCGRVFTKDELEQAINIFEKHNVYIISDEIWSDLTLYGNKHIPTQSINEYARNHTVALYAPSKTFNLAGLIGAYHIIYDKWLNQRIQSTASKSHYNSMNVLSMHALIGAYNNGQEWLKELKEVLEDNIDYAYSFIQNNFKDVSLFKPEGTYMLFINCKDYCEKNNLKIEDILYKAWEYGVYIQNGRPFNDEYSLRMNLALPKEKVIEAFDRLKDYVII